MADDPSWTPRQDMSLLCRVCANQHDYLIPIFEGEGLDHDMPNKMDKHLPIKVRENDKLPTQMCYQCASTIIAWSELVTNCLEADKKLSRMLKVNENKADTSAIADEDAGSDHYEDAYDDVGGGGDDDNDDEDFEKEIKQLISDAGVKIVVPKAAKAKTTRASTRKRKSEAVPVKKENKKSKPDTSVSKSSTALIKPKEEVTSGEDRFTCHQCQGTRATGCRCKTILLQCDLCCLAFTSIKDLINHIYLCKSKPDESLDNFKNIHSIYHCPVCNIILKSRHLFKSHLSTHFCVWHACDQCNKRYNSLPSLKEHMKEHELKAHYCGDCEKEFNSLFKLEEHNKIAHSKTNSREYIEKTVSNLKAHEHTDPRGKRYICETCGKAFDSPSYLSIHKRTHSGERPYVCELCGKTFPVFSNLDKHKNTVHLLGEKRFECSYCSRKFYVLSNLERHMTLHSDNKPVQCEICNKKYKSKYYVNQHKKRVHNNRPYHCNLCSYSFKIASHLKTHEKKHVNELRKSTMYEKNLV